MVTSVVKSDHKAVVAFADISHPQPKAAVRRTYRRHTPAQRAQFLQYAVSIDFTTPARQPVQTPPLTLRLSSTISTLSPST